MNTSSSAPKRGFSVSKLLFLLLIGISIITLGAQPVLALAGLSSFMGDNFNITPSTASSHQMGASVAYNSHLDQWLVVWKDDRPDTGVAIYGRRVDKNGTLLSSEIVVQNNEDVLDMPSVAYDSDNYRYLVVWQNFDNGNIEGRVLNENGSQHSAAWMIADCADCSYPDVVYNPPADEYLVVWEETNSITDGDIDGRSVGVDGVPDPAGVFEIASGNEVIYQNPAVAVGSSGKYLVVFSYKPGLHFNIGGQRLYQSLTKEGSLLSICSDLGNEYYPDVAINPQTNDAFVAWAHDTATGQEVKGRLVRADSMGGQPTLSESGGSDDGNPSLTYAHVGDPYLITWDNGVDVFGRWVNSLGALNGELFAITTASNTQYGSAVAFGMDRYLAAYLDWNTQYDIWGRLGTANPGLFLPIIRK